MWSVVGSPKGFASSADESVGSDAMGDGSVDRVLASRRTMDERRSETHPAFGADEAGR